MKLRTLKLKTILVLMLCFAAALSYMAEPAFAAQEKLTKVKDLTLKSDGRADASTLPENYVAILNLNLAKAKFTSTNTDFELIKDYTTTTSGGTGTTNKPAVVYHGKLNWGTSNNTADKNAVTDTTSPSGGFTLRYDDAAVLLSSDGSKTKADVILEVSNVVMLAGAKPSSVNKSDEMYVELMSSLGGTTRYIGTVPRKSKKNTSAVDSTFAVRMDTMITVVEKGTDTPVDKQQYPSTLIGFRDLDNPDARVHYDSNARHEGAHSEGIAFMSGFQGPVHVSTDTVLELVTQGDYQKIRNSSDNKTDKPMKAGFIVSAEPQGYKYRWYGSGTAAWANRSGNLLQGRHMATVIEPLWNLADVEPEDSLEWTVDYEWEGEAPDLDTPEAATVEDGNEYTVDASFDQYKEPEKYMDSEGVEWTFNGWDRTGTFEVHEDTTIHGSWNADRKYSITTEVVNGTITEDISGIPENENRTVTYSPDEGCSIRSVTVDGESLSIEEYPASYDFNDICDDHLISVVYEKDPVIEIPKPSIEKTVSETKVTVGDTVRYTVKAVTDVPIINAEIRDALPSGESILEKSITCSSGNAEFDESSNVITVTVPVLEDEVVITYNAKITEKGSHINIAELTGDNFPDGPISDRAEVKADPKKKVTEVKGVTAETKDPPQTITKTYVNKDMPKTGDNNSLFAYIGIFLFAAAAFLVMVLFICRRIDAGKR